ncbi:MAG TPA: heparan-alpha-glucosaminide N-acetyltransferase domain-containing protein, partial [Candidatus Aminicenantes bacterium]|nr:heparan-alpha-glucosaminide N-acetyltransferase domain-containing protein [Candidatus Aminicenantes bacterium]
MSGKTERALFVDRMRGLAMLVMIEVHVTNSLLLPALRETAWFPLLNFINGLVAPSFLFISGLAFGLAAGKKLDEFRRYGATFWLQLGRIGLIALLGFLLHLPYFSLRLTLKNWRWIHWNYFFSFDILHCIAAGLLFLFAARLLIRSDRGYGRFLIGGAAIALLAAPFAWQVDWWRIAPAPLAGALSPARPALFPLLPWLAFLFFGGIVSERFRLAKSAGADAERRHFRRLALLAAALIVLGRVFLLSALNFQQYIAPIRPNWVFFGYRLGWVLALLCLCRWLDDVKRGRLPWVVAAGRESLLVYVAHLMILYRHVFGLPNVV